MNKYKKICVIGNSGSGKSTLTHALSKKYNLPTFHLDKELLHGQFEPHPLEKQKKIHNQIISQEKWIIDGSYNKLIEDRIKRADLVIYLNVSRLIIIPRVIKRYILNTNRGKSVPKNAKNKLSFNFFRILLQHSRRQRLARYLETVKKHPNTKFISLTPASIGKWLKQIEEL